MVTKTDVQMWFVDELFKKDPDVLRQATDPHMLEELLGYSNSGFDKLVESLKPMIADWLWQRLLNAERVEIVE